MIAGVGHGLPRRLLRCRGLVGGLGWGFFLGERLRTFPHLGHNPVGLMAVLPRQFVMLPLHLCGRLQLLFVPCAVRCNLSRRCTVNSLLPFVILHLLPSRTRRLQILPRVALDLRLAVLAALQLVAELLQARCQLRAIDRRTVMLRSIKLMRLHGAGLPVLALGDVKDNGMGVELRRRIAIDGTGRVVLEGRGGELACRLRGMHVADPRLRVVLDLDQSDTDALSMRLPHPLIAADKRGQRNGFWCGERGIPSGAMLHACYFPAVFAVVGPGNLMPHKLLFRKRVLAFTQTCKVVIANGTGEAPLLGKSALPLAETLLVAAPVILPLRRELPRVVGPRLACRKRFGGKR